MAAIFQGQMSENTTFQQIKLVFDIILMIQSYFQGQKVNLKVKITKKIANKKRNRCNTSL